MLSCAQVPCLWVLPFYPMIASLILPQWRLMSQFVLCAWIPVSFIWMVDFHECGGMHAASLHPNTAMLLWTYFSWYDEWLVKIVCVGCIVTAGLICFRAWNLGVRCGEQRKCWVAWSEWNILVNMQTRTATHYTHVPTYIQERERDFAPSLLLYPLNIWVRVTDLSDCIFMSSPLSSTHQRLPERPFSLRKNLISSAPTAPDRHKQQNPCIYITQVLLSFWSYRCSCRVLFMGLPSRLGLHFKLLADSSSLKTECALHQFSWKLGLVQRP